MIKSMFHFLRNAVDFPLRETFRWKRKGLVIRNEEKTDLFSKAGNEYQSQLISKEQAYRKKYHLDDLYSNSRKKIYRINLYYLELLEKAFQSVDCKFPKNLRAVDVGCSQWFYIWALYSFYKWWQYPEGRSVALDGYEIDAYKILYDFHSRYDYALTYIRGMSGVNYHPKAFTKSAEQFDLITMFFPFIYMKDHLEWGLPNWTFNPQCLLADVLESLNESGKLLIVNQGDAEHEVQMDFLSQAGVKISNSFKFSSNFYDYKYSHFVIVGSRS